KSNIKNIYPLEVNLYYTYNYLPNLAASLSFCPVSAETRKQYINLFSIGHIVATTRHTYKDKLYLSASNNNELVCLLANQAKNPDRGFLQHLYSQFCLAQLGNRNGKGIFERLQEMTGELCYLDVFAIFNPLNISIILLYTSCSIGALPLGVFLISNKAKVTIENAINLLKTILPNNAFYRREPQVGPKAIITNDSNAKPLWYWLYDSKHKIHKDDRILIMYSLKAILYAPTIPKIEEEYLKFKEQYFTKYNQLVIVKTVSLSQLERSKPGRHQYNAINNIYIVPSIMTIGKFYTVNPSIGTCTYLTALGGSPYFHYIVYGAIAQDLSFYASLCEPAISENNQMNVHKNEDINPQNLNENMSTIIDITVIYIENFKKEYEKAESLLLNKLIAYLYQRNSTIKAELIQSGAKIYVQPASIQ
ncbi:33784_t:CDS:2, partial [Gigaspora margarita]